MLDGFILSTNAAKLQRLVLQCCSSAAEAMEWLQHNLMENACCLHEAMKSELCRRPGSMSDDPPRPCMLNRMMQ